MNRKRCCGLIGVVLWASTLGTRLALADAVTDWNEITTKTILTAGRSPVLTSFDYAIVHAAVYDCHRLRWPLRALSCRHP